MLLLLLLLWLPVIRCPPGLRLRLRLRLLWRRLHFAGWRSLACPRGGIPFYTPGSPWRSQVGAGIVGGCGCGGIRIVVIGIAVVGDIPLFLSSTSGGSSTASRPVPCRYWNKWTDTVGDIVLLDAESFRIHQAVIDAIYIFIFGDAVRGMDVADVDQHLLHPMLDRLFQRIALVPRLPTHLGRTAPIDDPGGRATIEAAGRPEQLGFECSFGVGILGYALVDIQFCFIGAVDLVHETINPVAMRFNDIRVAAVVNLPSIVDQTSGTNVQAVGTASLHLLEVQVTAIGKVERGWLARRQLLACRG